MEHTLNKALLIFFWNLTCFLEEISEFHNWAPDIYYHYYRLMSINIKGGNFNIIFTSFWFSLFTETNDNYKVWRITFYTQFPCSICNITIMWCFVFNNKNLCVQTKTLICFISAFKTIFLLSKTKKFEENTWTIKIATKYTFNISSKTNIYWQFTMCLITIKVKSQ